MEIIKQQIFAMPKHIALDPTISPRARLLYGHIESLSYKYGYCWASNQYLAESFGVDPRSIRRDITELRDKHLLHIELNNDEKNNTKRKIYPTPDWNLQMENIDQGGQDKSVHASQDKSDLPPRTNLSYPPGQICPPKNTSLSTQVEGEARASQTPSEKERRLSKKELVSYCQKLASNSDTAKSKAPKSVTQAISIVCQGWRRAGALPIREWGFISGDLYAEYIKNLDQEK